MKLQTAIKRLEVEYEKAKRLERVYNPLAYALYQVWRMADREICLKDKCGSCKHFKEIAGTCNGDCLKNPYSEDVVHDPKHPYWIVPRSRVRCRFYEERRDGAE